MPQGRAALPTDVAGLPPLDQGFDETLADGLAAMGLALSATARRAIEYQARLLVAWNEHINLTAIKTPEAIARLHVLDSLSAVLPLRARVPAGPAVLDLGSGGGYPGLPLAVALPAARLTLVDSVAKKVRFLETVAAAVGQAAAGQAAASATRAADSPGDVSVLDPTPIEALAARAEQLAADEHRATWDVVTARAVGSFAEVAELGLPLLRRGGLLVCWKRDRPEADIDSQPSAELAVELDAARRLLEQLGGDVPEVVTVEVPGLTGHRLVLVRKISPTPRQYPRVPAERRRPLLR